VTILTKYNWGIIDITLTEVLNGMSDEERSKVLTGFLGQDRKVAKGMALYLSKLDLADPEAKIAVQEIINSFDVEKDIQADRRKMRERDKLLDESTDFNEKALEGSYLEEASFEDKRAAYHNGDVYLEDFCEGYMEEVTGFIIFKDLVKKADKFWMNDEVDIAIKVYRELIEVYDHDTMVDR
jgi:hypothetical protein